MPVMDFTVVDITDLVVRMHMRGLTDIAACKAVNMIFFISRKVKVIKRNFVNHM